MSPRLPEGHGRPRGAGQLEGQAPRAGLDAVARFDAIALRHEIRSRLDLQAAVDLPLARYTTMRVGGPADLLVVARDTAELAALVELARGQGAPHLILGGGSDLVIADAGIRGLVIRVRSAGLAVDGDHLLVDAGVPMARAATACAAAGLAGLEFGLAIPGSIGGAIWANAGAHGSDVAAVLEHARVLAADGTERRFTPTDLDLGYRSSRLKDGRGAELAAPIAEIVLAADFRLTAADPAEIRGRLRDIREWRRVHQPLNVPSAGSYFRNPPGDSAGRLIDAAGLKGERVGGAVISHRHANFLVNDEGATASDVRRLGDRVRAEVARRFGVVLREEVTFAGDWGPEWTAADDRAGAIPAVTATGPKQS